MTQEGTLSSLRERVGGALLLGPEGFLDWLAAQDQGGICRPGSPDDCPISRFLHESCAGLLDGGTLSVWFNRVCYHERGLPYRPWSSYRGHVLLEWPDFVWPYHFQQVLDADSPAQLTYAACVRRLRVVTHVAEGDEDAV